MIWFFLALITLVALVILGYPLLSSKLKPITRTEGGQSVYVQQLEELDHEIAQGALSEAEAEPAKLEIQRRLLRAAREDQDAQAQSGKRLPVVTIVLLIAVPAASFALYSYLGSPDLESKPLASRDIEKEKTNLVGNDLGALVSRLAERLQKEPENVDGWVLLARTLSRMNRYEDAANTFLKATQFAENDPDLYVGAGENFYFLADGVLSDASVDAFKKALTIDPDHPGARYYLALQEWQIGNADAALDQWVALYEDSDPADAFMQILKGRIEEAAQKSGRDVTALFAAKPVTRPAPPVAQAQPQQPSQPRPTAEDMQAASNMSAEDRQDMIRTMVGRLASRMEEAPEFDGLMRLGQVYGTLGEFDNSAAAYGRAAQMQPDNPSPLSRQALALIKDADEGTAPPKAAIDLYRKILTIDESLPEALWYIGMSEARSGNREDALKHWNKLLALAPEGSPLQSNVTKAINSLSQ